MSARAAGYDEFQALDVQVLGISANNPFSQKTFSDSLKLQHPLLSDADLEVARRYGVVQHYALEPRLVARRAFFLIDKQGVVRGRWLPENQLATFPNAPILERIRAIVGEP